MNIGRETEQIEFKTSLAEQKQGFERTFDYCDKNKTKYEYEDTGLGFRFIFYRKNVHGHVQVNLTERDLDILELLGSNPSITIREISKKIGVTDKTISRTIKKLKELNKIVRVGSDKNGYWKIIKG